MIREAVQQVISGADLDRDQARAAMDEIMSGEASPVLVSALLVGLRMKGESVNEIVGLVTSLREHAIRIDGPPGAVDTCGTGGDRAGTFNISTAAAIVARGAGAVVAKHGNRASSSRCGSADVLEALGVDITLPPRAVEECLRGAGIAFLFAPTFHASMRHAAPVRGELGVRTAFNILGPLANPAGVRRQAVGVGAPEAAGRMVQVLAALGHERALVFHGADGLDELTTTGPSHVYELKDGAVTEYDLDPQALGLGRATVADLAGTDAETNAGIIREVLGGQPGPRREVVLLNTAAALLVAGIAEDIAAGLELAAAAVDSGAAEEALRILVSTSQTLAQGRGR